MKYKVGDKVKVRSDLKVGKDYGEHDFVHDMFKFVGKIVTIESVWKQGCGSWRNTGSIHL